MKPITLSTLNRYKQEKKKFATITAYDASFARLFANEGIPAMLIGDSLGMTLQGHDSTLPVTVEQIAYHTRCVRAGAPNAFLIADMPFMSYSTPEQACLNAAILMQAGANMVKIEGGSWLIPTVKMLTERAVPVCIHLGLTPQSVNVFGGYKVQGREEAAAEQLKQDAMALETAGAQLAVLECVPVSVAKTITGSLNIPVIGIGAGNVTDGQILVMHDLLGLTPNAPKFSKDFLQEAGSLPEAVRLYVQQVEQKLFPQEQHSFN
ncbi:TPA: 3-methyl-2-oxobutanoate hydroxymethyltransferase [Proteus mirabilis]